MAVPGDIDLRPQQIYHQPSASGNKKVIVYTQIAGSGVLLECQIVVIEEDQ
jgi:uncharacterized protein (UPF0333 family)